MPSTANAPRSLMQAVPPAPRMFGFQIFNAISFQIALGPPLILLARSWGASPLYIGAITSLVNWLALVQLFVAPRIEHIGYQKVMLSGWSGRVAVLSVAAALPFLASRLPANLCLAALFACMFLFNLLRGIASASWLPWLSWLVPVRWRGRYISVEQMIINLSCASTFLFCGKVLGERATNARFGLLLIISAIGGAISLWFLKKIPSPPPLAGAPQIEPFWRWIPQVWHNRPTRRITNLTTLWIIAVGAWGTFTIVFLRDRLRMSDHFILNISAVWTLGCVVSTSVWGAIADRFGSRPVLALSIWLVGLAMLCWICLALEIAPPDSALVTLVYMLFGAGTVGFVVGNLRYMTNFAPQDNATLAITFFSSAGALGNAVVPIVWGLFLNSMDALHWRLGPLSVTCYTLFYLGQFVFLIACHRMLKRLPEDEAAKTGVVLYNLLNDYPLRAVHQLYGFLNPSRAARETPSAAAPHNPAEPAQASPAEPCAQPPGDAGPARKA